MSMQVNMIFFYVLNLNLYLLINYDLTLQLQLFSLQILHRENIFSTKGFTMDARLLTAVSYLSFAFI